MSEAQHIGRLAQQLCDLLPIPSDRIRSILLEPRSVTFTIYELNEDGRKFVRHNGSVAMRTITRPLEWPLPETKPAA